MNWRDRATEAAVGGAAGLALNVLFILLILGGVTLGEWLQFAGVFLGVIATIGGTLWLQQHATETKSLADFAAFGDFLNRADDALQFVIDGSGDAWRYIATVDTLLLYAITPRDGTKRRSFDLDVKISALYAAWEACHPDMERWANQGPDDLYDPKEDLIGKAQHIQQLLREVLTEFNRMKAKAPSKREG